MHCKRTGEIEYDQNGKNFHLQSTCVTLEKNTQDFIIFPDFISIFQTFSRSGQLLGKFQDFFKNSRLCANPVKSTRTRNEIGQRI